MLCWRRWREIAGEGEVERERNELLARERRAKGRTCGAGERARERDEDGQRKILRARAGYQVFQPIS